MEDMEELLELTGEFEQLEYPSSDGEESSCRWIRRIITIWSRSPML